MTAKDDTRLDVHVQVPSAVHELTRTCWCEPIVSDQLGRPIVMHRATIPDAGPYFGRNVAPSAGELLRGIVESDEQAQEIGAWQPIGGLRASREQVQAFLETWRRLERVSPGTRPTRISAAGLTWERP